MPSYNKTILIGNLTRDVELKYTPSGTAVTEITLAVNEKYKDSNGEWKESASFIDCTLWGRTAEVANEYLHKGDATLVEGRLKQDTWTGKESGAKRSKIKVTVEKLTLLGNNGQRTEYTEQPRTEAPVQPAEDHGSEDGIPF